MRSHRPKEIIAKERALAKEKQAKGKRKRKPKQEVKNLEK